MAVPSPKPGNLATWKFSLASLRLQKSGLGSGAGFCKKVWLNRLVSAL